MDKVEIKEPQPGQKRIAISIPPPAVEEELSRIYTELGKTRVLKGFRPGKAPRRILEVHFGKEARSEAIGKLISSRLTQTLRDKEIEAVGDPVVGEIELKPDNTLDFVVTVDLRPRIELGKWKGLPLKKKEVIVSDEEVEAELENLRRASASFEPVDPRPLQADDWALVTSGAPGSGEGASPMMLEMERADESIRSQMIGMRPGEKRILKNPDSEQKAGADGGPPPATEVELKEVKKMILPEADDKWARTVGDFDGLDQLRKALREAIQRRKEAGASADLENQAVTQLLANSRVTPPPRALETMTEQYYRQAVEKGGAEAGEELRAQARRRAEEDLKLHFILDEIASLEKIEVTEEILNRELEATAARYGTSPASLREEMDKRGNLDGFRQRLRKRLAVARVVEAAALKQ